jgi:hypothetical protein
MKSRSPFLLSCAFAFVLATPAFAAWTPLQPGWFVHEAPVALGAAVTFPGWGALAGDPVSGDVFVVGALGQSSDLALYRISPSGQMVHLAAISGYATAPVFDPVHRVVLVGQGSQTARFGEFGAVLAPLPVAATGPSAFGPDGEWYEMTSSAQSASGLQIKRYDGGLGAWVAVRDVPLTSNPPDLTQPDQLAIDPAGRVFASHSGALYRVDAGATVMIGSSLIAGQLAVAPGMLLFGEGLFDPDASSIMSGVGFASRPAGHGLFGVAITSGPTVVFLESVQLPDLSQSFTLQVFTLAPTPAVQRSWGALKALVK